jgi:surface protein
MAGMFGYSAITNVNGLLNWQTDNVTDLSGIFAACPALTDISGLANWNTTNVTRMDGMFAPLEWWSTDGMTKLYQNTAITNINALSNWTLSSCTHMPNVFAGCTSLTNVDGLKNWDVSAVGTPTNSNLDGHRGSFGGMFKDCTALTEVDMSLWTAATTDYDVPVPMTTSHYPKFPACGEMFEGCTSLETLKFGSGFNLDHVTGLSFSGLTSLTTLTGLEDYVYLPPVDEYICLVDSVLWGPPHCDVSVRDKRTGTSELEYMFEGCSSLPSNAGFEEMIQTWNTSNVTRLTSVFYGCESLTTLD